MRDHVTRSTALWANPLARAAVLALSIATHASAATVSCGIGDRVHTELSGGKVGTIEEVGTQSPHVGWYRISYDWTPSGEWYAPATMDIYPEGSTDRCQPPATATSTATPAASTPARAPASAPAGMQSSDNCPAGRRVVDRQQRPGEVQGESNGMCVVALDDGTRRSYLAWMLSPEGDGDSGPIAGGLGLGRYVCSAAGAGHFDIHIVDAATYTDRAGKRGSYTLVDDRIEFQSGSLADYHSRVLGNGKFGLSTEPVRTFYVVCNRKA